MTGLHTPTPEFDDVSDYSFIYEIIVNLASVTTFSTCCFEKEQLYIRTPAGKQHIVWIGAPHLQVETLSMLRSLKMYKHLHGTPRFLARYLREKYPFSIFAGLACAQNSKAIAHGKDLAYKYMAGHSDPTLFIPDLVYSQDREMRTEPMTLGELLRSKIDEITEKHPPHINIVHKKKEEDMPMSSNPELISSLANSKIAKKAEEYGIPKNSKLSSALKEVMEAREKDAATRAAEAVAELLDDADRTIKSRLQDLRELRAREKQIKNELNQISRAKRYGLASENFVPLAVLVEGPFEYQHRVEDKDLLTVPKDFEANAEEPAKAE